jgi:hypothetical protein
MPLSPQILHKLTHSSDSEAWDSIVKNTLEIASSTLTPENAPREIARREKEIGDLDLFLSSCGWDLWHSFGNSVKRTSDKLIECWAGPYSNKAILILDALSLRELPWLLQGAKEHGFAIGETTATASELPGETDTFAKALGFGSRSKLQSNGGSGQLLPGADTESVDYAWKDCLERVSNAPNQIFWHHWPDRDLHDGSFGPANAACHLAGGDFWAFAKRLATGRRLIITSDHGYAATGTFPDEKGPVKDFLKDAFGSKRNIGHGGDIGPFLPPVALEINGRLMALGRRKWKSQGGYPALTHGGLTLLEVLSPWVELSHG